MPNKQIGMSSAYAFTLIILPGWAWHLSMPTIRFALGTLV
jgi:hypothetical protein